MPRLATCRVCGRPSRGPRCRDHQLAPRPRGNANEPTRIRIAERDRWTCGICNEPIDPRLRKPHPRALAIAHRTARANGGSDADENLVAAHADCNLRQGTRPHP
jgi:5-methylcytosine-specific restriction endonuclease McrA